MTSKWQKYLAIGIMVLVVILIVAKLIYNYKAGQIVWEEKDAVSLTNACLDDLGGYSVRFPLQSEEYCDCTTKQIMSKVTKADYLIIQTKNAKEQEDELLPVILDCYNAYQEAMFNASKLD